MKKMFFVLLLIFPCEYGESLLLESPVSQKLKTDLEQVPRKSLMKLGNVFHSASPCVCTESSCSCEFMFFIDDPMKLHHGKVSLTYDVNDGLSASLAAGEAERQMRVEVQPGTELPPLCVPLPQFPVLQFCAVFYDVRLDQNEGVHICLSLEGQALSTTLAAITFDCLNLGPMQIDLATPDVTRPSFIGAHLGQAPKITFFNSVSVGVIPTRDAQLLMIEEKPLFNFKLKPLKLTVK